MLQNLDQELDLQNLKGNFYRGELQNLFFRSLNAETAAIKAETAAIDAENVIIKARLDELLAAKEDQKKDAGSSDNMGREREWLQNLDQELDLQNLDYVDEFFA